MNVMKKVLLSAVFLFLGIFSLSAQEFSGFLNIYVGDSSESVEAKLLEDGWQKQEMFKDIIEYYKEGAELYGFPIACMDVKFNQGKLAMMTLYFNVKEENGVTDFNTLRDKAVYNNGYVLTKETGSFDDSNYHSTYIKRRKMLVINNTTMTDINFLISVSDIDLLLN